MSHRDVHDLVAALREAGYDVALTGNGHYKVVGAERAVFFPSTPSDLRSVKNSCAQLRRTGYEFEFRGKTWARHA